MQVVVIRGHLFDTYSVFSLIQLRNVQIRYNEVEMNKNDHFTETHPSTLTLKILNFINDHLMNDLLVNENPIMESNPKVALKVRFELMD